MLYFPFWEDVSKIKVVNDYQILTHMIERFTWFRVIQSNLWYFLHYSIIWRFRIVVLHFVQIFDLIFRLDIEFYHFQFLDSSRIFILINCDHWYLIKIIWLLISHFPTLIKVKLLIRYLILIIILRFLHSILWSLICIDF